MRAEAAVGVSSVGDVRAVAKASGATGVRAVTAAFAEVADALVDQKEGGCRLAAIDGSSSRRRKRSGRRENATVARWQWPVDGKADMYEDAAAAAVACVEPHRGIMAIWWVSECCREMAGPSTLYMYFLGRFYNSWEMINSRAEK